MSRLEEIRHRTDKPHLTLRPIGGLAGSCFHIYPANTPLRLGDFIRVWAFNCRVLGNTACLTLSQAVQAWYSSGQSSNRSTHPCL